ncbi:MAG: hypothetical protein E6H73_04610 [Betaproteobacteria bacterium]|nr:MAG: hypothetical protein E6H73_04610 [Betaproteobacteria bacterium]
MDALRVGIAVDRNIEFTNTIGQPDIPPRRFLDHAKDETLFLVLKRGGAAGREHSQNGRSDEQPSGNRMAFGERRWRHGR